MKMYILLVLLGIATLSVPTFQQNVTSNTTKVHIIPDGGNLEIQCKPENPNAIITWEVLGKLFGVQTNMSNVGEDSNFEISRNSSLIVNNRRNSSAIQGLVNVTCIANSSNSVNISTNVTLERILFQVVFYKAAKITNNKRIYDVPDDGTNRTTLVCNTTGYPEPETKWMNDSEILVEGQTYFANFTDSYGAKAANLTVASDGSLEVVSIQREDGFGVNVTCVANNTEGSTEETFLVRFLKAAKITNSKRIYDVPDDGSSRTTLICKTTGYPEPDTGWMNDSEILVDGQTYFANFTDSYGAKTANLTVASDESLEVVSIQREDGFGVNVTCFANNIEGRTKKNFLVRFLKAPKILTPNIDINIPELHTLHVEIPCQSRGYPEPVIHWLFGNVTLNSSRGVHAGLEFAVSIGKSLKSSYQVFENGSLRINNPYVKEHIPHRNFTCVASSFLGVDTKSHAFSIGVLSTNTFEIVLSNASQYSGQTKDLMSKILGVFEDLTLVSRNNVTYVNLTSGEVRFTLSWLEYDLSENNLTTRTKDEPSEEVNDVVAIANLVRQRLIDNGIDILSFLMNGKPGPATDLSVNEVTSSEISFSWKHPNYFTVTQYQIQRNDGGSSWKNVQQVNGDKTSTVLDGLKSGTKYLIRMVSITGDDTGDIPSEVVQAETEDDVPVVIIVVVVVLVVVVLIAVIVGVWYYRREPERPNELIVLNPYQQSIPGVQKSNIYIRDNRTFCATDLGDISKEGVEKEYFSWREISRESLSMGDPLGQGEFGLVVKAMWTNDETNTRVPVAVKTIKDNATETDRKELFKELRLMAEISEHPNVVNLIGACSNGGPLWVIVELCEHGNLLSFLRKNRQDISERKGDFMTTLEPLVRVRIAFDVAKGMRYLEDKKIIHRDLAARNILLGKNKIAKVSDFGLSRDIYERGIYQKNTGGKLPVKWMAIESLKDADYTTKSDVWSFGILFWEIETAGQVPYPGIGGRDLLGFLLNGFRLERPSETPFEIYEIMKKCWEPSPKVRPHFVEIESELEAYIEERSDYLPVLIDDNPADEDEPYLNYFVDLEEDETTKL